ncbi:hypothetical protein [Streptomyces aureocirculatus]|uniref:hypothetical protein n=1 Tax=Streptomyces aureocirculatus TaxID=67275 RepID=UPI0004C5B602|nr:hypothetical protein [Streptomyces aureocirculatus]
MESDDVPAEIHAQLLGAYWLDSPYLEQSPCCCTLNRPARPQAMVLRSTLLGLACLALTLSLAAVWA